MLKIGIPCRYWPALNGRMPRHDAEAGAIGALLVLPQAISLAMLAGMPAEYGIYTSIIPVIIAALWGSSWHQVSGPNTAVCVLLAATVAPLAASGDPAYIGYVLLLTLMVGVIQIAAALLRAGSLFDFVSTTIVLAIVQAVAITILISAGGSLLGLSSGGGGPLLPRAMDLFVQLPQTQPWVASVGITTVVTGLVVKRLLPRYALVMAVLAGGLSGFVLNRQLGAETTGISVLGELRLSLLPFSMPPFERLNGQRLLDFAGAALAIAFLGAMQTIVISRSIAMRTGQKIDCNQEVFAQGLANLVAPFVSAFAGSGSFNRSAANHAAGARSPMAAVFASLFLALLVMLSGALIARLPIAAIAGTLVLVAIGLFDPAAMRRALHLPGERWIFLTSLAVALLWGLSAGLLAGLLVSLGIYLWHTSRPRLDTVHTTARDGRALITVSLNGSLFFGSAPHVAQLLERQARATDGDSILMIDADHLSYIDLPGAELLTQTLVNHERASGPAYILASEPSVVDRLEQAGLFDTLERSRLMHRDRDHPMKSIIYPYHNEMRHDGARRKQEITDSREELNMHTIELTQLADRLRSAPLFGPIEREPLIEILRDAPLETARDGEIIVQPDQQLDAHIVLLDGELEAQRGWRDREGRQRTHTWTIRATTAKAGVGVLAAASRHLRGRALGEIQFLRLDADRIDAQLAWAQQLESVTEEDEAFRGRHKLLRQVGIFHHLPPEHVHEAFGRLRTRVVEAGDIIMHEGDKGEEYYLIEEGEAEVARSDPFSGETRVVDHMEAGEGFGEEALLQGGYRNATIRMLTPGLLLVLRNKDFAELVQPALLNEIDAEQARPLIQGGKVHLLDCRYDMEYEESRIPGGELIPLHRLRFETHRLHPDAEYIVYCRSGRRSKAAAFLLTERNFRARSLAGGIQGWPYEVDAAPLDDSGAATD